MLIDFRQLFPKYNLQFQGVLHIGANKGEERDVYLELGIRKQIWIEANPDIFLVLKQNIHYNPDATAFNYCIGDEEGKMVMFKFSNNGSQSSSILSLGTHRFEHPDVYYTGQTLMTMRRIDKLGLNLEGVDLLNVDLQGADLLALKGMGDLLNQFKAIYIEVNKDYVYEGCALVEEIDEYCDKFGFVRVETKWAPNKNWGDAFLVKKEILNKEN